MARTKQSKYSSGNRPNRDSAVHALSEKKRRKAVSRRMIAGIAIVLAVFCVIMGIQMYQKFSTLHKLKSQEASLKKEYQRELQISKELKEKKKYVQTDEYVEEMARKLGLLYPDEVILQPEK